MGGYIALELALRFPQRVQGLALLSTSARADSAEQTQLRLQQMALAQTNRFEQVIEHLLPRFLHPDHLRDDCLTGQIRQMCQRVGARDYLRQQQAIIGRRDQRAQLARIDCPTLVICGEQDQLTPMHLSEEMHAALPGSRLLRLADCGHLSALERPEACARALLEWLQLCEQNALTA
jgi:pimeloyl-ACP methyl ester carboxylesterase